MTATLLDPGEPGRRARAELRSALGERHPWVSDAQVGPAAVEAGECDRCGVEARLVMVCGPGPWRYLGRGCAVAVGADAWCAGHQDDAYAALGVLRRLPAQADTVARLWWVSTGEVQVDPQVVATWRRAALAATT